jgi:hypothetical protein
MAKKKSKTQGDLWQLSVRNFQQGGKRGTALEVYNPIDGTHNIVKLLGGEVSYKQPSPLNLPMRYAIAFERKLKEKGIDIPDARQRIYAVIKEKWFRYL